MLVTGRVGVLLVFIARENREERMILWSELEDCKKWEGANWVVGDDCNIVMRREERSSGQFDVECAKEFIEATDNLKLVICFEWERVEVVEWKKQPFIFQNWQSFHLCRFSSLFAKFIPVGDAKDHVGPFPNLPFN